jgi:ribosomal protein L37AE/L43A
MLTYIYFVKCPGCEDEHFDFFNDAKEFAMSLLSNKPIITQIEVDRNDFGECVDSCDLGTVWSWEDVVGREANDEPAYGILTKDDLKHMANGEDPEFDNLDNSVDEAYVENPRELMRNKRTDGAEFDEETGEWVLIDYDENGEPFNKLDRKPVPEGMTIDDLVEAMEENEEQVECRACEELHDKSACHYDKERGWVCEACSKQSITEAFNPNEKVEFTYDELKVTLQSSKRSEDDWDEAEESVRYSFYKTKEDVATDIWENFIEEADVKDVDGGLETLEDDKAWNDFLAKHFDDLLDKHYDKLLDYYKEDAQKEYEETHSLDEGCSMPKSFLEEFEEPEAYRARLTACPECGASQSFDHETGICIDCGFNI